MDGDLAAGDEALELIPALLDDEFFYDDYDDLCDDDLYDDVHFGDGLFQALYNNNSTAPEREHGNLNDDNQLPPPAAQAPVLIEEAITGRAPDRGLPSNRPGDAQARADNTSNSGNEGFGSKGVSFGNGEEGFSRQGGGFETEAPTRQGISNGNVGFARDGGCGCGGGGTGDAGGLTTLFVGELQWWTTDADVEGELCKYGQVKEVRFFDEKATGKSKGYCQVEFYDPVAAAACAEGMNGHVFNGRPCVAALATHYSIRKMGDAQVNRNRQQAAAGQLQQPAEVVQKGRGVDGPLMNGRGGGGGRGDWGRGGRGIINPPPPVLHPGAIWGPGFDPNGFEERVREKERARERGRKRLKDRNRERDRDMHRDERHRHGNHYRHRDREAERYDDWRRSSRAQSRSCEIEHAKRRRLSCERRVSSF